MKSFERLIQIAIEILELRSFSHPLTIIFLPIIPQEYTSSIKFLFHEVPINLPVAESLSSLKRLIKSPILY